MTKKSFNRLQRDEAKAQGNDKNSFVNSFWQDLDNLYFSHLSALDNAAMQVRILYSAEGLKEELAKSNGKEISIAIRGLQADYSNLRNSLTAIYDKHKDLDKTQKSDEDAILAVQLGGEYEDWRANFLAAIMPNVEYLIAEINMVLNRVRRETALKSMAVVQQELAPTPQA